MMLKFTPLVASFRSDVHTAPRNVYIDLGVNFANTLRLHHDLLPEVHANVLASQRSPRAWEIYGFEASPLIQPYANDFVAWLDGGAPEPVLRVPPAGSTAVFRRYARFFGCCASNRKSNCNFLPCMLDLFRAPWATMSPDRRLNSSALVAARLAEAAYPNEKPLPRYTFIPAAAGSGAGWLDMKLDFAGALSNSINHGRGVIHAKTGGSQVLRVRVVDFTGWLREHFRPEDTILLKMDIEGAEHRIIPLMLDTGALDLVDLLAWECHAPSKPASGKAGSKDPKGEAPECQLLSQRIAERNVTIITEESWRSGHDAFSSPTQRLPVHPSGANSAHHIRVAHQQCAEQSVRPPSPAKLTAKPQPWRTAATTGYVFNDPELKKMFASRQRALSQTYDLVGRDCVAKLFGGLRENGATFSDVGLSLTSVSSARHPRHPGQILEDLDVQFAVNTLMSDAPSAAPSETGQAKKAQAKTAQAKPVARSGRLAEAMLFDQLARRASTPSDPPLAQGLLRDGFVKVGSWGIDVEALSSQAMHALDASPVVRRGGLSSWTSSHAPLPALAPLLQNETIARVLRAYLGGQVRYDGHVVLRLNQNLTIDDYLSGYWHHDRCGRRLKLFIFLHDVAEDGRPTLVARTTHDTLYYRHGGAAKYHRFTEAYVRARHEVVAMSGPRGGGFLFDTNALHQGVVEGRRPRTTVILEFHALGKLPRLRYALSEAKGLPCPSIRNRPNGASLRGTPGLDLYPQDVA